VCRFRDHIGGLDQIGLYPTQGCARTGFQAAVRRSSPPTSASKDRLGRGEHQIQACAVILTRGRLDLHRLAIFQRERLEC
jgi:hypothetical protein